MAFVAIDTNLLLLLIVGRTRRDFIPKHKRLKSYTEHDFEFVARMLKDVDTVLTTPNVLTEVSNLLVQGVLEPLRTQLLDTFKLLVTKMDERYSPSVTSVEDASFAALGLTDANWLCCLSSDTIFVTDDLALTLQAQARGLVVLNVNAMQ